MRKSLFRGKADNGFSTLLGCTHLAAELMEHRSSTQGNTQAKGVHNLLRQSYRFVAPRQPLVRIAQEPQRPSDMAATHHASILPIEERRGTVLLGSYRAIPCIKCVCAAAVRSQAEQRPPQGTMRRHEHGRVLGLLCQGQELLAQFCAVWISARTL